MQKWEELIAKDKVKKDHEPLLSMLWKINQTAMANSQGYKSYWTNDKFRKIQNM